MRPAGFTLIELMIAIGLTAILVAICVPSFTPMIERYRLTTTTERIVADISLARTEALHRDKNVYFVSRTDKGSWCQGIDQADVLPTKASTACNCSAATNGCDIRNVTAVSSSAGLTLPTFAIVGFEPIRGLANFPAGATSFSLPITSSRYALTLTVSQSGVITVCIPTGKTKFGNYPAC